MFVFLFFCALLLNVMRVCNVYYTILLYYTTHIRICLCVRVFVSSSIGEYFGMLIVRSLFSWFIIGMALQSVLLWRKYRKAVRKARLCMMTAIQVEQVDRDDGECEPELGQTTKQHEQGKHKDKDMDRKKHKEKKKEKKRKKAHSK